MAGPAPQSRPQTYSCAEDEAIKRNTDCVYFLASPLTCKKGNECEFRHSEVARLNPRDCFFWLNGNCLNPKCAFRHPPLDGLLPKETTGSTLPSSSTSVAHHPSASVKQAVACVFFQSGYCLKGDRCSFLHAPPNCILNTAPLKPEAASAAESVTSKNFFNGPEKFAQKECALTNNDASIKGPQVKPPPAKAVPVLTSNEFSVTKRMPTPSDVNEFPYRNVLSGSSGNSRAQPPHLLDEPGILNNKDSEEISREHSPGFDVLVDDERRDDEYYPSQDQYAMSKEREISNDYDAGRSTDYNKNCDINKVRFQKPLVYDSREHFKGQHSWEDRASSERMPGGPSYLERRPYPRMDTYVEVDELDLRHRLINHKKANGLRSVISREHSNDRYANNRTYQGTRREDQHTNRQENSLGSRLRGRIMLPERPSQGDRSVDHHRLLTVRSSMSSHLGRVGDRILDRAEPALCNGGRNHRGMQSRSDIMDANFSGPKSLAELKKRKSCENNGADKRSVQRSRLEFLSNQQALAKRKHSILDNNQPSGNDLCFEGPKPLHEILKRKKTEITEASNGCNLFNNEVNNQNKGLKAAENETSCTLEHNQPDESAFDSVLKPVGDFEAEEGMIIVEEEPETYEQTVGESEEDLGLYEGENGDDEELEYYEEEEDDDFAKKMGVKYV